MDAIKTLAKDFRDGRPMSDDDEEESSIRRQDEKKDPQGRQKEREEREKARAFLQELARSKRAAQKLQKSALNDLYSRATDCASKRKHSRSRDAKARKSRKRRRHRSSSDSSSRDSNDDGSSSESREVFRFARGSADSSAFQMAKRSPGGLTKAFVKTLRKMIGGRGLSSRSSDRSELFEPIVTTYVTTLLLPTGQISKRNTRELLTLATALDHLFLGEIPEACDVLTQRFKAVELASAESSWVTAQHIELVPELRLSSVTQREQEEAIRREAAWRRVVGLTRTG
jgi:hypothetical protein